MGIALGRLVRSVKGRAPASSTRPLALLLLWLTVPVLLLGTRTVTLWWYYLDVLYPSQFIFAGLALTFLIRLPSASPVVRKAIVVCALKGLGTFG